MRSEPTPDVELVYVDLDRTLLREFSLKLMIADLRSIGLINRMQHLRGLVWFILYKLHLVKEITPAIEALLSVFSDWAADDFNEYISDLCSRRIEACIDLELLSSLHRLCGPDVYYVLVTSSLDALAAVIAHRCGFDGVIASVVEVVDGRLTGRLVGEALSGGRRIRELHAHSRSIALEMGIASIWYVADHDSDIPLFEWADHPCVVAPGWRLRLLARSRSWRIFERS